jgi:hypothetical protein
MLVSSALSRQETDTISCCLVASLPLGLMLFSFRFRLSGSG